MSTRRLADEAVQPAAFAFSKDNTSWAKSRIGLYPKGRQQSAVIPLLMRAQEQEGWVSRAAIEKVAEMLGMAYIRVLEVATFYTQFQLQPVGTKAHVQVCGTTPCMLRGAEDLRAVCQKKIHSEAHHTNESGTLSWEEVECAGACVNAPMVTIGMDTYEDLTPERLEEIIDQFEAGEGASVPTGPQNDRQFSAALGGATTLTNVPKPRAAKTSNSGSKAKRQSATTPGRKREVSLEAAPAVKGPSKTAKVSVKKANGERKAANKAAKADGRPNDSARPTAVGAESKAGKIAGGAKVGKGGQLFTAPKGKADDLKLISGVGPVLEKKLNAFGVTQWSQIAAFKKADIDKLDEGLNFRGRIARDEWVKQAKALAKGGVEEYRKVFGKDPR